MRGILERIIDANRPEGRPVLREEIATDSNEGSKKTEKISYLTAGIFTLASATGTVVVLSSIDKITDSTLPLSYRATEAVVAAPALVMQLFASEVVVESLNFARLARSRQNELEPIDL